jgi:hypothetical protein
LNLSENRGHAFMLTVLQPERLFVLPFVKDNDTCGFGFRCLGKQQVDAELIIAARDVAGFFKQCRNGPLSITEAYAESKN